MDRREFLRTTGAVAATAAAAAAGSTAKAADESAPVHAPLPSPAIVAGTRLLRVAMSWPDNGSGPAESARRLVRSITQATEGRLQFEIVVGAKSGIGTIAAGEADAYFVSEDDNREQHPAFAYFAGLPGRHSARPFGHAAWMSVGGGQVLWDSLSAEFGVKAFTAGHTGRSIGLSRVDLLSTPADLVGRKVWAMGLARDVLRGLGAEPVTLPPSAVAVAIEKGEISAVDAGGAITSFALGALRPGMTCSAVSISRGGTALSFGLSRAFWEAMSAADQTIVSALCTNEFHTALAEEKAHRQLLAGRALSTARARAEENDLLSAVARVSDAVVAHLAAIDARTERIRASRAAFAAATGRSSHLAGV
ncbi:MAG: hypothetical protein ACT4N2_05210 [Hyphomicrobium sp.]